jgi:hypothetical protein
VSEKHYYSLIVVAEMTIFYLMKYCEKRILCSIKPSNALEVHEASDISQNMLLKEKAMNVIVKNAEPVVLSTKYYDFVLKNAHFCVEITR